MTVLYPGDSIHLTLWFNPLKETMQEAYDKVRPIFEANRIHIYSWSAIDGVPAFPMQVIAFRVPNQWLNPQPS